MLSARPTSPSSGSQRSTRPSRTTIPPRSMRCAAAGPAPRGHGLTPLAKTLTETASNVSHTLTTWAAAATKGALPSRTVEASSFQRPRTV